MMRNGIRNIMKIDRFKASSKAPGLIRCCVLAALVFAFTSKVSVAQKGNDHRHLQYRTLWTKSVLATLSACKIKIAANDIAPGEEDCSFTGHLPIGSKVFVVRRSNSSPWARLRLRDEDKAEFEVYL